MAFRFQQFTIEDAGSTLRVGTDAMLLGSWANPGKAKKILDIGTGCGVLSLMMAQKSEAIIDAIEIDPPSVLDAKTNFRNSPWADRISVMEVSLQCFSGTTEGEYEFVITNPPYYTKSLKSPSARINQTRHDESLSLPDLAMHVHDLLAGNGCFALILPFESANRFQTTCAGCGLYPSRSMAVYPKPGTPPKRVLMEFTKTKIHFPEADSLTILDASGKFTAGYLAMTQEFHRF
jgi:tRNA1Val (adenine37-N6)-methyltransferase